MAIDHGLGGKDSAKNNLKRTAKARRNRMTALSTITTNTKRNELIFDDEARTKYLTGFRSRKQSRRKYGLAMQVMKEKKARHDSKKEMSIPIPNEDELLDADGSDEEEIRPEATEIKFSDKSTSAMFGGVVSVVVDTGVADELDQLLNPDQDIITDSSAAQKKKKEPTRFQKALKVAGDRMQRKYFKQGGSKRLKKTKTTKLMHKAMGSGALGKNVFKGSKKKR
jgi:hypothetical protein